MLFQLCLKVAVAAPSISSAYLTTHRFQSKHRLSATRATSSKHELPWELQAAVETLDGIKTRTGSLPLDLLGDFYDPTSKLVSPGVWHNAMTGIACLKGAQGLEAVYGGRSGGERGIQKAEEYREWAMAIAVSLFQRSFIVNQGFRRRVEGSNWEEVAAGSSQSPPPASCPPDESIAVRERIREAGEDPSFYMTSTERRGGANALACIFYSLLAEAFPEDERALAMRDNVSTTFSRQFFDPIEGRFRMRAVGDEMLDSDASGEVQWRAVDQALGALAAMRITKDLGKRQGFRARAMAASSMESLLTRFGYGPCAEGQPGSDAIRPDLTAATAAGTAATAESASAGAAGRKPEQERGTGGEAGSAAAAPPAARERTSWDDALCVFAVLACEACSGAENPKVLVRAMERDFGIAYPFRNEAPPPRCPRLMAHSPIPLQTRPLPRPNQEPEPALPGAPGERRESLEEAPAKEGQEEDEEEEGEMLHAYSSTQAIWLAVLRAARLSSSPTTTATTASPFSSPPPPRQRHLLSSSQAGTGDSAAQASRKKVEEEEKEEEKKRLALEAAARAEFLFAQDLRRARELAGVAAAPAPPPPPDGSDQPAGVEPLRAWSESEPTLMPVQLTADFSGRLQISAEASCARLWANTEFAAFLLMDPRDFSSVFGNNRIAVPASLSGQQAS